MVGGEKAIFDRCLPVFSAMGKTVTYIGDHGMGLVAKMVNQMLMEATFCAVAESFAFAVKAGADVEIVYEAVRNGLAGSKVLDQTIQAFLSGELGTGRELTLHYKDGGYAGRSRLGQRLGTRDRTDAQTLQRRHGSRSRRQECARPG